jgi:hypothetical protein
VALWLLSRCALGRLLVTGFGRDLEAEFSIDFSDWKKDSDLTEKLLLHPF